MVLPAHLCDHSDPRPIFENAHVVGSSPRGSALSARQAALWAGGLCPPSDPVWEARAAVTAARAAAPGRGGSASQKLRPGAGHGGGCRGDARIPGGADTAAERAADPGVRPALGVWGSEVPCVACVSASPGASACLKSTGFGVLASCLEPVPLLKVELLFPSLVLLVPPPPAPITGNLGITRSFSEMQSQPHTRPAESELVF